MPSHTLRIALVAALGATSLAGCLRGSPPGDDGKPAPSQVTIGVSAPPVPHNPGPPSSSLTRALERLEGAQKGAAPHDEAKATITIAVTNGQAPVYVGPSANKEGRIGYLRRGARVQAEPELMRSGTHCTDGWYKLVPLGYVCARFVTADLESAVAKAGNKEPSLDDALPYVYARNASHGTPLYRNVPTRDEMAQYEPYLKLGGAADKGREQHDARAERTASADAGGKKKKRRRGKRHNDDTSAEVASPSPSAPAESATAAASAPPPAPPSASPPALAASAPLDADAGAPDAGEDESSKPWFMRKYDQGKNPEIKLSDLTEGADGTLVKRMAQGFYVSVDRTFAMNNRLWHKTTEGLLAPADRMSVVKAPSFKGEEIDEAHAKSAVAFVINRQASRFEIDAERKAAKPVGAVDRYHRAFLTGERATVGGKGYRQVEGGNWLRESDITFTEPGAPPSALRAGEKWVDVNITRQTLVAFEGDRPVFATLVSSGRKGKDKAHDHTTPRGMWRVREKHIAATMDGDGAAAGDMPYSIEDVPYILYFHESYALHAAFWHDNFGRQQSHGCVNLAPLDAKRIFFWSEPSIPKGWHGMLSSQEMPGTLVVVHE